MTAEVPNMPVLKRGKLGEDVGKRDLRKPAGMGVWVLHLPASSPIPSAYIVTVTVNNRR